MYRGQKNIRDMLVVVSGNIVDARLIRIRNIDTIVNAAKPTLMGSDQGVDGIIHKTVNNMLASTGCTFAEKICDELHTGREENVIRCERGKSVVTSGYGLCGKIMHVVGIPYDEEPKKGFGGCSSSRARTLESCYEEIVNQIKARTDIRNIAIPIIGSGEYGFPFELALKIAIATIGNALVAWKKEDAELFEMAAPEQILLYVYHPDNVKQGQYFRYADGVLKRYMKHFVKGERVVYQFSAGAHRMYLNEIYRYDKARGYFSVARSFRMLLMFLRLLFLPSVIPKDIFGRDNWEHRRTIVECFTFGKMLLPLAFFFLTYMGVSSPWFLYITIYCMCDTITYLLTLIMMADIQKPSANIIRSLLMLFVNYLEVAFELAYLYYALYFPQISVDGAIAFGILGNVENHSISFALLYANAGTKFFFASLVFGYFVNHMRLRQFRS